MEASSLLETAPEICAYSNYALYQILLQHQMYD
jgi:hypothetical protein